MNSIFIIVAAGTGKRFGLNYNKLLYSINGKPLIYFTLKNISDSKNVNKIIIVCGKNDIKKFSNIVEKFNFKKVIKVIEGGPKRQISVYNGLKYLSRTVKNKDFLVGIHDGARINIKSHLIEKIMIAAKKYNAAAPGVVVTDTVKQINTNYFTEKTLPRDKLILIRTPQVFKFNTIFNAYKKVNLEKIDVTDDVAVLEYFNIKTKIIKDTTDNVKITYPEDLKKLIDKNSEYRTGNGFDVHKFVKNRKLYLGGVKIPYAYGLEGHSDADVLIHSIIDALLGAAGMRDIGYYFPDNDNRYKNIRSAILLKQICKLIYENNFTIVNIDSTIILEKPKLKNYIEDMIGKLSNILKIDGGRISIKATTTEGLGFTGREEGIAVLTTANLRKINL